MSNTEGVPLNEIAILCVSNPYTYGIRDLLEKEGINVRFMGDRKGKTSYNPVEARVSIMQIPSSKGLEFDCVIVLGAGDSGANPDLDQARLTYVAMTRARNQLLLTSSSSNKITERLMALSA